MRSEQLHGRHVAAEGIPIYAVEGGIDRPSSILFLHGWPESWAVFRPVMAALCDKAHVVAIDLPGVGKSENPPASNDKRTLAGYVRAVIESLGLRDVTLAGHDVGGQIAYAFLHLYPHAVQRAVIMNVAIPGVDPWPEVIRNPQIWHFGFHAVPGLPEKMVTGRQAEYFDFFYDRLSRPGSIGRSIRAEFIEAYARPEALRTGFEWYRAFTQDENDNLHVKGNAVETPVLCLRGELEGGKLDHYVAGLSDSGLRKVEGVLIAGSGHFAPLEAPGEVVKALSSFTGLTEPVR